MSNYQFFDEDYHSPYSQEGTGGLVAISIVVVLVIIGVIFLILYLTCTTPFGTISDKCSCKSTGGTWDDTKDPKCTCKATQDLIEGQCLTKCTDGKVRDSKGVCGGNAPPSCTSTQELVENKCVEKCATGQVRDSMGVCQLSCSAGKVSNGLKCVDDLSGNYLGYITSTGASVPSYKWNIKHTTGGVAIYSDTTLKITTTFDGSVLMWGAIKGTWDPLARRITWSNDSHWIKQ